MALLCYLCKFCTTGSPFPDSDVKFRASSLRVSNVILFPTKKSGSEISKELSEGYSRNYLTGLAFLNKSWGTDGDRHGQVRFNCRIQNLTDLPLFGRIVYVSKHSGQFLKLLKSFSTYPNVVVSF